MGHCAPTAMQTVVDASAGEAKCALVVIGLRHGRDEIADGLPVAVDTGCDLLQRFEAAHGSTECRAILGDARLPLRCVGVVRQAPSMCAQCLAAGAGGDVLPPPTRKAYRELYAHWHERGFHCADAAFDGLGGPAAASADLRDAATCFMGGTLFTGRTCSALTAGVMALGLARGKIEDSRPRVLRMLATMAVGRDATADRLNAFNPVVNLGHELAAWFGDTFGSTQCRALTGCDFASADDVRAYVTRDGTAGCERIARKVATRVADLTGRDGHGGGKSRQRLAAR